MKMIHIFFLLLLMFVLIMIPSINSETLGSPEPIDDLYYNIKIIDTHYTYNSKTTEYIETTESYVNDLVCQKWTTEHDSKTDEDYKVCTGGFKNQLVLKNITDKKRNAVFYVGMKYADSSGTPIEQVKNLKTCEFCNMLNLSIELDPKYPLTKEDILSYNLTSITLNAGVDNTELNKDIPITVYDKSLTQEYNTKINIKNPGTKQQITVPFGVDKILHIGESSTTVVLNTPSDDLGLYDNTNGAYGFQVKTNISALPPYNNIESAELCVYWINTAGSINNNADIWRVDSQTWTESDDAATINSQSLTNGSTEQVWSNITFNNYGCVNILPALKTDYKGDHTYTSVRVTDFDNPVETVDSVGTTNSNPYGSGSGLWEAETTEDDGGTGNLPYINVTYSPVTTLLIDLLIAMKLDDDLTDETGNFTPEDIGTFGYTDGYINSGGSFSGDDLINTTIDDELDGGNYSRTISFMFKPTVSSDTSPFAQWLSTNGHRGSLIAQETTALKYYHYYGTGSSDRWITSCSQSLDINNWQMLTVTYSPENGCKFYYNGSLCGAESSCNSIQDVDEYVTIGAQSGSTSYIQGVVDEFTIWRRELNTTEIIDLFNLVTNDTQYPWIPANEYTLNITYPTTESPKNVTGGDNISINFTYTYNGALLTSDVNNPYVEIGGSESSITNYSYCSGTLNCLNYETEAECNNCSQCNYTAGGGGTNPVTEDIMITMKLDDNLTDETGNFTPTYTGDEAYESGYINNGFTFSGDDYIDTTINDELDAGNYPRTLNLWFYPTATPGSAVIIGQYYGDDGQRGQALFQESTTLKYYHYYGSASNQRWVLTCAQSLVQNKWQMLTVTYNGAGGGKIYYNGSNCGAAAGTSGVQDTDQNLLIGYIFGSYIQGVVDEVTVWKKALNATEISGIFTNYTNNVQYPWSLSGCLPISGGSCGNCNLDECDTNCSGAGCSQQTADQFAYIGNDIWQVNVTTPTGFSDYQNLLVRANYTGNIINSTETNAIYYPIIGDCWTAETGRIIIPPGCKYYTNTGLFLLPS